MHETSYAHELHIIGQNIANAHTTSAQANFRLESFPNITLSDSARTAAFARSKNVARFVSYQFQYL